MLIHETIREHLPAKGATYYILSAEGHCTLIYCE